MAHLYKTLVDTSHPRLQLLRLDQMYAAQVSQLESVQRFAARLCTKQWQGSCSQLLAQLNWSPLQCRHTKQKLILYRRILHGDSIIPSSHFTLMSNPNPHHYHHDLPLQTPLARTNCFKSSFFVSTTRDWNTLPNNVVSALTPLAFRDSCHLSSLVRLFLHCI